MVTSKGAETGPTEGAGGVFRAAFLGWAAWGIVLVFAPCVSTGIVRQAWGWGLTLLSTEEQEGLLHAVGWGSLPVCALAGAVAYVARGRLARHARRIAVGAVVLSVAYLVTLGGLAWTQSRGDGVPPIALWRLEWPLRHLALCAWAVAGPAWGWHRGREAPLPEVGMKTAGSEPRDTRGKTTPLETLPEFSRLSAREREVMAGLLSGESVAAVARAHGLSPSSVSTYRARALEKLGAGSVMELRGKSCGDAPKGASSSAECAGQGRIGVGSPGWAALLVLAFSTGYLVRLVAYGAMSALLDFGEWDQYADTMGRFFSMRLEGPMCALVWLVLWPAVWVAVVRVRGGVGSLGKLRIEILASRPDSSLCALALAVALQGLLLGGATVVDERFLFARGMGLLDVGVSPGMFFRCVSYLGFPISLGMLLAAGRARMSPRAVTDAAVRKRCVLYLRGRGLGELQAEALLLIAEGRSTREVCSRLHVARGTVNAYRAQGYAALGIHSREELSALLERDVGPWSR